MPTIAGLVKNAANELLTGQLWVQLDAPLKDTSTTPDSTLLPILRKFNITAGTVNLTLPESESQQISYWFRFFEYLPNSTTDVFPNPVLDFRALVPNVSSIEFDDLIPVNVSTETIGINAAQIAQIIVNTPAYAEIVRGDPRYLGNYNAIQVYRRGEAVKFAGTWWMYINDTPIAGIEPSAVAPGSTYWLSIGEKGDPGGTGGNDVAFGAGWDGATWAPSANALYDYLITLATASSLSSYAPIGSPVFTGNPSRSASPLATDNSTQLTTTAWVRGYAAPLASPALTGNPTVPTQPISDESTKIASTQYVRNKLDARSQQTLIIASRANNSNQALTLGTFTQVACNVEHLDALGTYSATGTFTVDATGWYKIVFAAYVTNSSAFTTCNAHLFANGSDNQLIGVGERGNNDSGLNVSAIVQLTASTPYDIRLFVTAASGSPVIQPGATGQTPCRFSLERLSPI